jgi:O-6-methylguanine DNA methyltransferase
MIAMRRGVNGASPSFPPPFPVISVAPTAAIRTIRRHFTARNATSRFVQVSPSNSVLFYDALDVPSWGRLWLIASAEGLAFIRWGVEGHRLPPAESGVQAEFHPKHFQAWKQELHDYFAGRTVSFDLPISPVVGTPFQRRVWRALREIPYGEVRSYRWVAEAIGKPGAARAVGGACGANPIPIVVPCHRVVAQARRLGGYTGGVQIKIRLLQREGIRVENNQIMEASNGRNI